MRIRKELWIPFFFSLFKGSVLIFARNAERNESITRLRVGMKTSRAQLLLISEIDQVRACGGGNSIRGLCSTQAAGIVRARALCFDYSLAVGSCLRVSSGVRTPLRASWRASKIAETSELLISLSLSRALEFDYVNQFLFVRGADVNLLGG